MWCLYTWSCLDILITMINSVNCSTVICSPTVEYLCSWEKPLVKPMAPRVYSHHINLHHFNLALFLLYLLFFTLHLYTKNTKNIISIRSHSRKWPWRDWQPLYRVGCEVLICLCMYGGLACGLLLDWYLGSQKLREILTLLCCITLSSSREKPTQAQEVARRISGAVAGEIYAKSSHTKHTS